MLIKRILLLVFTTCLCSVLKAQSQKEFSGPFPNEHKESVVEEPVHRKDFFTPHKTKAFKWKRAKVTHTAQYEFYKRVEKAAKEHQRMLKKLYRPQFSDFLYYGHKRKPKKHAPDKMRYCKECGIRH